MTMITSTAGLLIAFDLETGTIHVTIPADHPGKKVRIDFGVPTYDGKSITYAFERGGDRLTYDRVE